MILITLQDKDTKLMKARTLLQNYYGRSINSICKIIDNIRFKLRTIKKILSRSQNVLERDRYFLFVNSTFLAEYEKNIKDKSARVRKKVQCR